MRTKQAVAVANRLVDEQSPAVVGHFAFLNDAGLRGMRRSRIPAVRPLPRPDQPADHRARHERSLPCGRGDDQGRSPPTICWTCQAKKIAIHDKDTYGQGLADATARRWRQGTKEVLYEGLPAVRHNALHGDQDRRLKPDVVYFGSCHPEAGPLVRQMP